MHLHFFLFNLPLLFNNFCEYFLDIDNCQALTAKIGAARHVEILCSQRRNSLVLFCMLVIYEVHSKSSRTASIIKCLVSDPNRNYMWREMNTRPVIRCKIMNIDYLKTS